MAEVHRQSGCGQIVFNCSSGMVVNLVSRPGEFSKSTKREIAMKANYLCSFNTENYRCLRLTSCKSPDLDKTQIENSPLLMGEAAHIVAASKNGPRGDVEMGDDFRSSEDNGIWLCQIHAAWIDKDNGNGYTIEQLREMKKSHENYIRRALEEGNCEYLSTRDGNNTLTIINDFSYPENLYRIIALEVDDGIELTDEQVEESIENVKQTMKTWEKEPIEFRQLAGVVFQYGNLGDLFYSSKPSVQISLGKLLRLMNSNERLINDFIIELSNSNFTEGEFVPCEDGKILDNPDTVILYGDYLYYLKQKYPDFNFQKLFMYGETDFT